MSRTYKNNPYNYYRKERTIPRRIKNKETRARITKEMNNLQANPNKWDNANLTEYVGTEGWLTW